MSFKKVYCCTPVAFPADEHYFIRDTGLICRNLLAMGIESKCIMPLPYHDKDQREHLIRTEYSNLESPEWWKSLAIDALVLYSWGAPRYRRVARAVRKAGITSLIHLDMSSNLHTTRNGTIIGWLRDMAVNILRARHLSYAHVVTASAPTIEAMRNSIYYGKRILSKTYDFPTPVAPHFCVSSEEKEYKVVCVGRWSDGENDEVKRPEFCIRTAQELVKIDPDVRVEIYGRTGKIIEGIYESTEIGKERIALKGYISNQDLPTVYQRSLVSYCTSKSEGTHISSAEALCCGCSIAVTPRPRLNIVQWYTSKESGTVSSADTPESLAKAIFDELQAWKEGRRSSSQIANAWQQSFHVNKALKKIFNL